MLRSLPLLRREITYSAAKEQETNVLHSPGYWEQKAKFFGQLYRNRDSIEAAALRHLSLGSAGTYYVGKPDEWLHGSFNVCIPVTVSNNRRNCSKQLIIRFPLPYRVCETFRPGNADEKLRWEAGTYAWLQNYCSSSQSHNYIALGFQPMQ